MVVCCERAPNESDLQAVTSGSLAGPSRTIIAKADEHHIGPNEVLEKPSSPLPSRQWTSHLEYCDFGFRSSGDAAVDVVRLGALCGHSNGLTKGSAFVLRRTDEVNHTWFGSVRGNHESSTCGRITVGLAGGHEHEVRVELRKAGATEALFTCHVLRSGFCPERELACDVSEVQVVLGEVDDNARSSDDSVDARTDGEGLAVHLEWWTLPSGSGAVPLPNTLGGHLN